jgi:manganese-dependent inorganic pyrophosphatase
MSTATFVEKQVWGSCATILATKFLQYNVPLMPNVAGLILGAIISDTLNFKSPTTTDQDKRVAGWLAPQVNWPETHTDSGELRTRKEVDYAAAVFALASEQFTAKSNLSDLTATEITLADFKQQPMPSGEMVGWGQCETVDPFYTSYLQNSSLLGFVDAMRAQRDLQSLDFMYVSYVDIWSAQLGQSPRSSVVCLSKKECDVLKAAFPGTSVLSIAGASDGAGVVDTSPRVSRKLQFIPAISAVLI